MSRTATKAKPALIALTLGLLLSTTSVMTAAEAPKLKMVWHAKKMAKRLKQVRKNMSVVIIHM